MMSKADPGRRTAAGPQVAAGGRAAEGEGRVVPSEAGLTPLSLAPLRPDARPILARSN